MGYLYLGVILFFGVHVFSATPLKKSFSKKLGEKGYKGIFALVSLLGLILMIYGKSNAFHMDLFSGFSDFRPVAVAMMWVSFVMISASILPNNIKRFTRHPMLWGIVLWSGSHLLVNGDKSSVVLFGSFLVYSIFAMVKQTAGGAKLQSKKVAPVKDALVLLLGTVLFFAFVLYLHGFMFGVALK